MRTGFISGLISLFTAKEATIAYVFDIELMGQGITFYYTSHPSPVTVNGQLYAPAIIELKGQKEIQQGDSDAGLWVITSDAIEPWLNLTTHRIGGLVSAVVRECFYDGADWKSAIVCEGQLLAQTRTNAITIESTYSKNSAWRKKKIPGVLYSRTDQRQLFTPSFGVSPTNYTQNGCVKTAALVGNELPSNNAGAKQDGLTPCAEGYYNNGYIEYVVSLSVVGLVSNPVNITIRVPIITNKLTAPIRFILRYPPPLFGSVTIFKAVIGYDGSASSCYNNFSDANGSGAFYPLNLGCDGFLGFPHMPPINPAVSSGAIKCWGGD